VESSWVCREKETAYSRQKGMIAATKEEKKDGAQMGQSEPYFLKRTT